MSEYVSMPELPASPDAPTCVPVAADEEVIATSLQGGSPSVQSSVKPLSHRQQAASDAISALRTVCEAALHQLHHKPELSSSEVEVVQQYRGVEEALLAFQRALVYKGRRKNAILRCNRAPGTFSVAFRLRTLLARSDLYPVMVGPLEVVATVACDAVVAISSQLCELGKCVEAELLCHVLLSAVILSFSQVDAVVAIQGRAVASVSLITAPVNPEVDSAPSEPDDDTSFASTAQGNDAVDRLKRIERDAKGRIDVKVFRRLAADWAEAVTPLPAHQDDALPPHLKGLQAIVSTVLRSLYGFAVLPWPRVAPSEWVPTPLPACFALLLA
jgi:hypothetical protein